MAPSSDRVPLVIGVTGHRDLRPQDIARLELEIGAIFDRLRNDYLSGSLETPLVLVSALAEGADRLAARVALAKGAQLMAPLPLPPDEYRRDFENGLSPDAVAEFDRLLSHAISSPVVPFTQGNSLDAVRADSAKRAEQYRAVGLFIIQQCDVLIALWDGNEGERAVGGTAEVVAFKRKGILLDVSGSAYFSLDGSEIGPVIHVVTPRNKPGSPATEVAVRAWGTEVIERHRSRKLWDRAGEVISKLLGRERHAAIDHLPFDQRSELESWQTFAVLTTLTNGFNREAALLTATAEGDGRIAESIDGLFIDPDSRLLDPVAKQYVQAASLRWCQIYGVADALAQKCQTYFKRDWFFLIAFGIVAFICLLGASHAKDNKIPWILAYGVSLLIILVSFSLFNKWRHQDRFLDYRALAEALRVAVFWNLLGIDGSAMGHIGSAVNHESKNAGLGGMLASSYPIKQPSELAWVKTCLRTLERLPGMDRSGRHDIDPEAHSVARRFWLYGQLSYFGRQGTRHNRRAEHLEDAALVLFVVTVFFLFVVMAILAGNREVTMPFTNKSLDEILIVAVALLPGFAAALTSYAECLAMKAQARQYDRMRMLFRRAYELLPEKIEGSSTHLLRSLYGALGVEAMKESADWVSIYRQRPIRPVQH